MTSFASKNNDINASSTKMTSTRAKLVIQIASSAKVTSSASRNNYTNASSAKTTCPARKNSDTNASSAKVTSLRGQKYHVTRFEASLFCCIHQFRI